MDRARCREISGYSEKHHVIPRCMGGSNKKENIVRLTPEEHFLAHQLLVKIYPNNHSLVKAANMMCVSGKGCIRNNKMFGWLRKRLATAMSLERTGKKMSEDTKQKLREANLGKKIPLETIEKIKHTKKLNNKPRPPVTEETREKIRIAHKGKKGTRNGAILSEETKKKLSEKCGRPQKKGIPRSEEVKRKISETLRKKNVN
jgi:hypothetical protein